MTDSIISYYPHIRETKKSLDLKISTFLEHVRNGHWQDIVLAYRTNKTKENKSKLPYVTVSGQFTERSNSGLSKHSGYIAMDLDGIEDILETKSLLCADNLFYSVFVSCGGSGLCAISRINPKLHLESFNYLSEYLFKKYNITQVDEHCKDVSRPRFISYDPDLWINKNSELVEVKAYKKQKPPPQYVFVQSDFDRIVKAIVESGRDITEPYNNWITIGFALANKYGEAGREYFHAISQFNANYDHEKSDRKFTHLLKTGERGLSMGVVYNLAKANGIEVYSDRTKQVIEQSNYGAASNKSKDTIIKELQLSEAELPEFSPVIDQVLNEKISIEPTTVLATVEKFIKSSYALNRNEISRNIELNGIPISDLDINTIFLACKRVTEKSSREIVSALLFSHFIPSYNPFFDFIKANTGNYTGNIDKLIATIQTDTPNHDLFIRKWLVAVIASFHGFHSPLVLVLCGAQNTGKTEWFRRLLPKELHQYYAEDKLDQGKDSEILMTKKLIIMDDEMGGKNKQEEKRLKEMTSRQSFSIREPYGHVSSDLQRLAMLCGTTNDEEILNDPTGNRRILPVRVLAIDYESYNQINKTHLFIEIANLYQSGYNYNLSRDEIITLNESTTEFKSVNLEEDMILKYYEKPKTSTYAKYITSTDIYSKIKIQAQVTLSIRKIGITMKNIGFKQIKKRIDNTPLRMWEVMELSDYNIEVTTEVTTEELPF